MNILRRPGNKLVISDSVLRDTPTAPMVNGVTVFDAAADTTKSIRPYEYRTDALLETRSVTAAVLYATVAVGHNADDPDYADRVTDSMDEHISRRAGDRLYALAGDVITGAINFRPENTEAPAN